MGEVPMEVSSTRGNGVSQAPGTRNRAHSSVPMGPQGDVQKCPSRPSGTDPLRPPRVMPSIGLPIGKVSAHGTHWGAPCRCTHCAPKRWFSQTQKPPAHRPPSRGTMDGGLLRMGSVARVGRGRSSLASRATDRVGSVKGRPERRHLPPDLPRCPPAWRPGGAATTRRPGSGGRASPGAARRTG